MAMGAIAFYNTFFLYMGDGTFDFDAHTFKVQLHTSTYTFAATHSVKADLSNEVANANGYTTGGATLSGVTYAQTSGVAKFDADDVTWTASGGSIVARRAVLLDDTPSSPADPLMGSWLLDTTPADVTTTDGNSLTLRWHANGLFRVRVAD